MDNSDSTITVKQLAAHLNLSYSAVKKAIHDGRLSASVKQLPNGRYQIDKGQAIKEWQDNTKAKFPDLNYHDPTLPSYKQSVTIEKYYQAQLIKLKYKKEKETLVCKAEVNQELAQMGQLLRTTIMNVPGQISHLLATETQVSKIHQLLEDALDEALSYCANQEI